MYERERSHNQFILVHSLPELHSVPRKLLGFPLTINQHITNTQHHKEVILTTQEHSPSLPFTQPLSEQSSDLTVLQTYKYTERKQLQELKGTDYTWYSENHRAPKISS